MNHLFIMNKIANMTIKEYVSTMSTYSYNKWKPFYIPSMDFDRRHKGGIVEITGLPAIGKTSLVWHMIVSAQRDGIIPVYINAEVKDPHYFIEEYDVVTNRLILLTQKGMTGLNNFCPSRLIILDSLPVVPEPWDIYRMFQNLYERDSNLTVIVINQFRTNLKELVPARNNISAAFCNERYVLRREGKFRNKKQFELFEQKTNKIYPFVVDNNGIIDYYNSIALGLITHDDKDRNEVLKMTNDELALRYTELLNENTKPL